MENQILTVTEVENLSREGDCPSALRVIKLMEETGELSAAFLKSRGAPNASASAEANLLEEVVDVITCVLDIAYDSGITTEDIQDILALKCAKWRSKILSNQNLPMF